MRVEPGEREAAVLATDWAAGMCLPAEHYLLERPDLLDPPDGAIRLVFEELCLRLERGEEVSGEELRRRFPRWATELALMLDCQRLLDESLPRFPKPGESLGGFQLIREIGRGAQSRVFQAAQTALAERPVVVKLTPLCDDECLSLARLQHPNIIPLQAVFDYPARGLRAMAMPYLGGETLDKVFARLPAGRRSGQDLVALLDAPHGPRRVLARASYAAAVCWIGAALADGLRHAHERGVVHLDIKPSNILLAADGTPMLLDFHLALSPIAAGATPERMGGTPRYMSPEQADAFAAAARCLPVPARVDHRSDVYSLGKLMQEALEGQAISRGLRDILAKCVARRPEDRYADAAGLAADLRRHLASKPLIGVPNRDPLEALAKWNRRHPAALLWASVLVALAGAAAALGAMALTPKPDEAGRRRGVEALTVELRRQRAEGCYHRALYHAATGDLEAAGADCDRALTLDPTLAEAALQRGVVRYRQGRHAEALVDLERAERGGADTTAAAYNQALVRAALGELTQARACVQRALRHRPDHAAARQLAKRLEGSGERHP